MRVIKNNIIWTVLAFFVYAIQFIAEAVIILLLIRFMIPINHLIIVLSSFVIIMLFNGFLMFLPEKTLWNIVLGPIIFRRTIGLILSVLITFILIYLCGTLIKLDITIDKVHCIKQLFYSIV